jgi:hypothetical protein
LTILLKTNPPKISSQKQKNIFYNKEEDNFMETKEGKLKIIKRFALSFLSNLGYELFLL